MAFRRKRRRPVVQWHRNIGSLSNAASDYPNFLVGGVSGPFNGYGSGSNVVFTSLYRLVEDYPPGAVASAGGNVVLTQADYAGSGYRLRRIVGKCFVSMANTANDSPPHLLVSAGIIVANVDETDGSPLKSGTPNTYSPLWKPNESAAWIWQRSWLLSNPNATYASGPSDQYNLSYSNAANEAGSVMDGPHIDAKTNRLVGPRESLLFVFSAANVSNYGYTASGVARFVMQYRVLKSPNFRAASNRGNSSI